MLSRWVRERLVDANCFGELENRLESFIHERKLEDIQSGSDGLTDREQAKLKAKAEKRKSSAAIRKPSCELRETVQCLNCVSCILDQRASALTVFCQSSDSESRTFR